MNGAETFHRNGSRILTLLADYLTSPADPLPLGESKPPLRGIRATLLRRKRHATPDPSRVISGDPLIERVLLVGPQVPQVRDVEEGVPVVVLAQTTPGYMVARPAPVSLSDYRGYQAGGAYIVHDGCWDEWIEVFGHALPIPLHDYSERKRKL